MLRKEACAAGNFRKRRREITQMVNLKHTEHGHNGLALIFFGIVECRVTLQSVKNDQGKSELSPLP